MTPREAMLLNGLVGLGTLLLENSSVIEEAITIQAFKGVFSYKETTEFVKEKLGKTLEDCKKLDRTEFQPKWVNKMLNIEARRIAAQIYIKITDGIIRLEKETAIAIKYQTVFSLLDEKERLVLGRAFELLAQSTASISMALQDSTSYNILDANEGDEILNKLKDKQFQISPLTSDG